MDDLTKRGFTSKDVQQAVYDETRLSAFLNAEESRCKHKIRSSEESSTEQRIGQSRLHLISQIRAILGTT